MPNISIDCPYCSKPISSGFYLKHIFSSHQPSLFDSSTEKGKQNRFLIESTNGTKPLSFYFPNSQENHCCLHCMVSCSKLSSAQKHFDKEDCKTGHLKKLEELRTHIAHLPASVSSASNAEDSKDDSLDKNTLVLAIIHQLQKQIDVLQEENQKLQNTMKHLVEKQIDIHEWDDEDISLEEEEDDPTRNLDLLARAMKWTITRSECEKAYQTIKPTLLDLLSVKKRVSKG